MFYDVTMTWGDQSRPPRGVAFLICLRWWFESSLISPVECGLNHHWSAQTGQFSWVTVRIITGQPRLVSSVEWQFESSLISPVEWQFESMIGPVQWCCRISRNSNEWHRKWNVYVWLHLSIRQQSDSGLLTSSECIFMLIHTFLIQKRQR